MESRINYTLVGFFVVLFSILTVVLGIWISEYREAKEYVTYVVHMNEPAAGISENTPVEFNGVRVGYVKSIALNRKDIQQVTLVLQIEKGTPITEATVMTLMSQGLTGVNYVGLKATSATAPLLKPKPGEAYPVIAWEPSFLVQLDTAIRDVSTSIKSIARGFSRVLTKENQLALKHSLKNIERITRSVAKNSKELERSLKNLDVTLDHAAQASKRFPNIAKSAETTLENFDTMSFSLKQAGRDVTETMRSGRTLVENLNQETVPQATELFRRLNSIAANLESVSQQLQQNPAVVVRGRTPMPPGPGERGRRR